jgi:hypothetical protein
VSAEPTRRDRPASAPGPRPHGAPSLAAALAAELAQLPDEELAPLAARLAELVAERASVQSARPASPWMTATEAGAYLRPDAPARGRRRVYELVADGRLARHGDGRRLLVSRREVERLAAGR